MGATLDLRNACHRLVDGYRPVDFPNLSRSRIAHKTDIQEAHFFLDLPSSHQLDLDALILVAYSTVLGLYCAVSDVLVGYTHSNDIVYPVRLRWDSQTTWQSAIQLARSAMDQSLDTQIPLSLVQETLQLKESQSPFLSFFGHSTGEDHLPPPRIPFLLFRRLDSQLSFLSTSDFINISVASTLLQQIASMAKQAAVDQSRKLMDPFPLPSKLTSAVEAFPPEHKLSYYSHLTPVRIATDFILPHVESTPSAIAVCWYPSLAHSSMEFSPLSYIALHHNANRFAQFLLHQGLRPEDRVAVCMDRNLEFHSVLFGILRAGGCYVPVSTA